jgi:hypothetical protein
MSYASYCKRTVVVILACILWHAVPVYSQQTPSAASLEIKAAIAPGELTVGDLATYTITVESPPNLKPVPPSINHFEGFDLVDQGATNRPPRNGKTVQEFWYRLRADRVGFHTLRGPEIKYQSTDNSAPPAAQPAPEVKVQIRSVLYKDGEPEDIHDIKPIYGAGWPWQKYFWPIAGGLLLAFLMGYLAKRWAEKRRVQASPPETQVSPQELALRELQGLYDKGLLQKGRFREHYFELSEIYRRYLGLRFQIPALDWTSEEITRYLHRNKEIHTTLLAQAKRLLQITDLIKFAKAPIEETTAVDHMKAIRDFIKATGPKAVPKPEQEAPVAS